jgi:ribosomal protein S18 acetylase RimI-like enzyme
VTSGSDDAVMVSAPATASIPSSCRFPGHLSHNAPDQDVLRSPEALLESSAAAGIGDRHHRAALAILPEILVIQGPLFPPTPDPGTRPWVAASLECGGLLDQPGHVGSTTVVGVTVTRFDRSHLTGILTLCEAEGWPSLPTDPERALGILDGAGALTTVALDGDSVVGFALAFVDGGALDAYLSMLAVHATRRREGIARLLLGELFRLSGVQRIDLLAEAGSEPFYESLPHFTFQGYRIYPRRPDDPTDFWVADPT